MDQLQTFDTYDTTIAPAVDQVCSPTYAQYFEQVAKEQPNQLSYEQRILLAHYPNTISWYQGNRRQEMTERIRRTHLKWFNDWLGESNSGLPPYIEWNSVMENIMLHITNLLFRIDIGDIITSDETRRECQDIADTIKRILLAITKSNPETIDPAAMPLVQQLLAVLFYLTVDNDLAIYLKNLQLVDLMNVLIKTSNNDDEIHLQAFRILAVIMAESDIKQLQNANRIAAVFITIINNVIDGGEPTEGRLHNSLRSLKILTQHDQIRDELIKQDGYPLFLRCVLEDAFKLKAKLLALEILLALAFSKEFATTLKENEKFMTHIRTLTSSREEDLQRVATALIWKLEKELEPTTQKVQDQFSPSSPTTSVKKQYDIMISYSHSDKDLSHRILDILEKDNLRVWIDSRLMHGATFDAMAKAIENTEFVLMCMSDSYKQSPFCEMEASYAVKRRCHIIPLKVTPNYQPDGWLGVMTSARIYVDFPKLGFDRAYEELKKQMGLFRINNNTSTDNKQDQAPNDLHSLTDVLPKQTTHIIDDGKPFTFLEYPHCIDTWTEEHVKSFVREKGHHTLIPILDEMDGQLLHESYSMCQANQQGMFLSFKEEVAKSHGLILTLKDYLKFLREIKPYIPYTATNEMNPASVVCNLM